MQLVVLRMAVRTIAFTLCLVISMPASTIAVDMTGIMVTHDAANDTTLAILGNHAPIAQSITWTDLAELRINEDLQGFWFHVIYHEPATEAEAGRPTSVDVRFRHGQAHYWLDLYSREQDATGAALWRVDPNSGGPRLVSPVERIVDDPKRSYSGYVPRHLLADEIGAPPYPGRELTHFYVTSFTTQVYGGNDQTTINDWDRMPDQGVVQTPYVVQHGTLPSGSAHLFSPNPYRGSNGGAATYVFEVTASNSGEQSSQYALSLQEAPTGWEISIPLQPFELAPGAHRTFPVVVSTPSAHQHGNTEVITLMLQDLNEPASQALLELAITYHAIPQPAGHHDTLYIHSRPSSEAATRHILASNQMTAFMNTLENDEVDSNEPAPAANPSIMGHFYEWEILLDPSLQTGLVFDTARTGELLIALDTTGLPGEITIHGALLAQSMETTELASIPATKIPLHVSTGPLKLQLDVIPLEASNPYVYSGPTSLILHLIITPNRPASLTTAETPTLAPGGIMQLPLKEYREPIKTELAGNATTPFLAVIGEPQRQANPGDLIMFEVAARNPQSVHHWQLYGPGAHHASLIPMEDHTVAVVVAVPEDAGNVLDLVLEAQAHDETSLGLARLLVLVDDEEDYPDDAQMVANLPSTDKTSNTPGFSAAVAVLAMMGLAGVLSRRRRGA